jgi:hypothetical protein
LSRLRVLRNAQGLIDHTFLVGTTPTDPDGNTATVDITRADGSVFGALSQATTRQNPGIYRYTLAPQADLEIFTFLFEGLFGGVAQQSSPTLVEIVGSFFVPLVDIRALDGLSDVAKYPNAKLEEARAWFEDLAERFCGVAFVPRYGRDVLDGDGTTTLLLSRMRIRKLLSVKVDGVAVATSDFKVSSIGKLTRTAGSFPTTAPQNVEITYEHGYDAPEDDLRNAALTAIRDRVMGPKTGIPDRAVSVQGEFANVTLSTAGPDHPTGIPSVDEVLIAYSRKVPGIA